MKLFGQKGLQGHRTGRPFHGDIFQFLNISAGPVTVDDIFRNRFAVKVQERFDLILTAGLLLDQIVTNA